MSFTEIVCKSIIGYILTPLIIYKMIPILLKNNESKRPVNRYSFRKDLVCYRKNKYIWNMKSMLFILLSSLGFLFVFPEQEVSIDAYSSETVINIKLNDGEKWEADTETTASIKALQEICSRHYNEKTLDDELLKEELTAEVNNLNRVTRLKGDARSQLHNYQMGIRNRINVISQDRETLQWMMDYLKTYYTYFE